MAFKKGQSGNPGGRPKAEKELVALAQEATPAAFSRIVELTKSADERVALSACQLVIERGYGKPKQQQEHTGEGGGPIVIQLTALK